MKFGLGQPVRRREDARFLTGHGNYTDDLAFPGQAFAAFARSPHAHADILGIDLAAASRMPGVVAILTHKDVAAAGAGLMPCHAPVTGRDGAPPKVLPKPLLAENRVTFIGEAVAMVVAESAAQAQDAAEQIQIDYRPRPAVARLEEASTGPVLWDGAPGNLCLDWAAGDQAATAEAFARAAHVVRLEVIQNRVSANPMETRNAIGLHDAKTGRLTIYSGSQGAANLRGSLSKALNRPVDSIRAVTGDVGGGFGMKNFLYPEQPLVLLAAEKTGRPVRWSATRAESFLADDHGRDMRHLGELALDAEGRILALRITGSANMGAYLSIYAPFIATQAGARIFGGLYRVPSLFAAVRCYYTNSAPVDAYRGAGRPEAAYLMERLMDLAAAETGLDRVEIRRRNLPAPGELPMRNYCGVAFDSGDYPRLLTEAARKADVAGFADRRSVSDAKGLKRGLGIAYYVEITAAAGSEPAAIKFRADGGADLYVGTQSNGQGHETAFAQLVAERLGIPFEIIRVHQGDTEWVNGGGTGGSRSLNMAGGALMVTAEQVIEKGKKAASQLLQAGGAQVRFESAGEGRFVVGERQISLRELAALLKREPLPGLEEGLDSAATHQGSAPTFPNGCHICEVEADPQTGKVEIVSYSVLDDFGRVINPMLVEGQVMGGIVQGLGQALMEEIVYDRQSGQLLTGSFADYAMPRAEDCPDIAFSYEEIFCRTNALGAKGCGEAGTVGALPAIMSAIADAIGIPHLDMPATPERVWRAFQQS